MRKSSVLLLFGFTALSWGQTYTITTVAGAPPVNATSVTNILLYTPEAVHIDRTGMIYIADSGGRRIYKINPTTGTATAIIGNGANGSNDVYGVAAAGQPTQVVSGMTSDAAGNLYFSDRSAGRIKKIDQDGKLSGMAGANVPGSAGFNNSNSVPGDGYPTTPDPKTPSLTPSSVNTPRGMCVDPANNLVWADSGSNRVRKINLTTGIMSTVAGNTGGASTVVGSPVPGDGGPAVLARLSAPEDVACAADGSYYIADTGIHRIRKVSANGIITTIAGSTVVSQPSALVTSTGGFDNLGNPIQNASSLTSSCSYTTTQSATVVPNSCGDGRLGTQAQFNSPSSVHLDANGNLIISDRYNNRLRTLNLSSGVIQTLATGLNTPGRIDIDATGRIFVPEMGIGSTLVGTNAVKTYDPSTNQVSLFVGSPHFNGDGGSLATGAIFNQPTGIAVDGSGNIFVSDTGNHRVRMIDTTGGITTIVGTGQAANNNAGSAALSNLTIGNGVLGSQTRLNSPKGLAVDQAGNLYIADSANHRIVKWNVADQTTQTVAGTPGSASSNTGVTGTDGLTRINGTTYGEGTAANVARLSSPQGVAVDVDGNIYIADTGNHTVRMVSADLSSVTTIGGTTPVIGNAYPAGIGNPSGANNANGYNGYAGDFGPATAALLNNPTNVAISTDKNTLIIADSGNNVVRKVVGVGRGGQIYTILGVGGQGSNDTTANTPGYALRINQPTGVAIDKNGFIWVSDMNNGRVRRVDPTSLLVSYPLGQNGPSGAGSTSTTTFIQALPPVGINWAADVTGAAAAQSRIAAPWGITIGPDGSTAYVVDSGNGQVRKIEIGK